MGVYFLFTRLSSDAWARTHALESLKHQVADCVRGYCPELTWVANFRVPGRESYLDVVEAPYGDAALRLAVLIRNRGFSHVDLQAAELGFPVEASAVMTSVPTSSHPEGAPIGSPGPATAVKAWPWPSDVTLVSNEGG